MPAVAMPTASLTLLSPRHRPSLLLPASRPCSSGLRLRPRRGRGRVGSTRLRVAAPPSVPGEAERAEDPSTSASASPGSPEERFVWRDHWYPVSLVEDLDPRVPTPFQLLNRDLVIWNDPNSGDWVALDDRCPHRLAPLSEGRIDETGGLQCSYHGWSFDGSGACTRIPQAAAEGPEARAVRSPRACATKFPTLLSQGLLFVWPDENGWDKAKATKPPMLPKEFDDPAFSTVTIQRDLFYGYDTLMENVSDPSHIEFAHHKVTGRRDRAKPLPFKMESSGAWGYSGANTGNPRITATFEAPCYALNKIEIDTKLPIVGDQKWVIWICSFNIPMAPGKTRSHKPVLPLTRKGYRAVASIQLAHKKTLDERQSAILKAPSWPPWKEERLGIDRLRGNEGMYSRAMYVLAQMREAGYSRKLWEDVCSILAGWDTDRSPTIQTRSFMPWSKSLWRASHTNPDHPAIWTARIRATRTVREAWACFLSYQDRSLPLNAGVYTAMAEKLIHRQIAIKKRFDESDHVLPGDGREVFAEPASARDVIYVHTEPPGLQDFLEQMSNQGIRIHSHLLTMLLQTTSDFRTGLRYLSASKLPEDHVEALTTVLGRSSDYEAKTVLRTIPDDVFGAFVGFLCRASSSTMSIGLKHVDPASLPMLAVESHWQCSTTALSDFDSLPRQNCHPRAFWHAIQMTKARLEPCTVAWTHILSALDTIGDKYVREHRAWRRILAWNEALMALKWMKHRDIDLSLDGFYSLCKIFNGAVHAGLKHPDEAQEAFSLIQKILHDDQHREAVGHEHFEAMVENGLLVLKSQFDSLVLPFSSLSKVAEHSIFTEMGAADSHLQVPTILHIPSFAIMHRFVRVLGAVGDEDGVLHLLQWMSRSASALNAAADERLNGDRMRRLTLTAIRLILQGLQTEFSESGLTVSNPINLQKAHEIVSRTPGWEWPSDEEVEDYYQRYKSENRM